MKTIDQITSEILKRVEA